MGFNPHDPGAAGSPKRKDGRRRLAYKIEEARRILMYIERSGGAARGLRKATKTRGAFPSEEAALKLLFLVIRNVSKKWKAVAGWRAALNHFAILWPERMALAEDR